MKMIDQLDAAHMTDVQFVEECWTKDFTYQDYLTNCEYLKRSPLSKETYRSLCKAHDVQMSQSISKRQAKPHEEAHYFRTL